MSAPAASSGAVKTPYIAYTNYEARQKDVRMHVSKFSSMDEAGRKGLIHSFFKLAIGHVLEQLLQSPSEMKRIRKQQRGCYLVPASCFTALLNLAMPYADFEGAPPLEKNEQTMVIWAPAALLASLPWGREAIEERLQQYDPKTQVVLFFTCPYTGEDTAFAAHTGVMPTELKIRAPIETHPPPKPVSDAIYTPAASSTQTMTASQKRRRAAKAKALEKKNEYERKVEIATGWFERLENDDEPGAI